ncbi:histidine phosphatase family protein [Paenibacillus sp. FSL M7-1046]|uniref:histidine phosphatase family protein n=1 Tax=Paenibacillus sp. FSL M7-1046 TaxID=2975315 RepID=UPI0030FB652B
MSIYLVRHGKDDEGFRGGWSQRGLIAEGIEQSKKLGQYLKAHNNHYNIQRVVSSDLSRAVETATEIASELRLPFESSNNWREMNNGLIAGMAHELVEEQYPGLYFSTLRMDEEFPGGESPIDFFTRIQATFRKLCEEEQLLNKGEGNILIVTHGGVINIIYHILNGVEWSNKGKAYPSTYTSLHHIQYDAGKWEIAMETLSV